MAAAGYEVIQSREYLESLEKINEPIIDETGDNVTAIYAPIINNIKTNLPEFSRDILRYWEIRSWTHLNCPWLFNSTRTNWGYYKKDPAMGLGYPAANPLFQWCIEQHGHWTQNYSIPSYFFPAHEYILLQRLDQSRCYATFGLKGDGGRMVNTGIILTNGTDNPDGPAGKVLYIAFRETTGFVEAAIWNFCSWERAERYPGNHMLNRYVNRDSTHYTPGVNVVGGLWYGAYCSNDRRSNRNSIRRQLLEFVRTNGISQYNSIIITGVSLGGALAQCVALDLCIRTESGKIKLVLFASPRAGGDRFVQIMNDRKVQCIRMEFDERDQTVGFPRPIPLFSIRWRHIGIPIRLGVCTEDIITELGQGVIARSVLEGNQFYLGREPIYSLIPIKLIFGTLSRVNVHNRINYFKWIFSFYVKHNNIQSPAHGFNWDSN